MKKENLISNLGFVLIVIDLIVIFIFQKNAKIVLFAIAIGLLIYGIMSIFKKNVYGYITTCLSISLSLSGIFYFSKIFDLAKAFTFMISSSVFILMALTLCLSIYKKKVIDREFALSIEAEVIELLNNPNTDSKFYQPLYKYNIEGHEYTVPFPAFVSKNIPKIGDRQIIRVDERDHQNVYFEKRPIEKAADYFMIVFFLVVSLIIMIGQFK